ncbi:MAG: hypothetical protein DK303_001418 [Chloroflexi bacterium]|jgi:hypothetical protein|nr:MAG: hypothetical protein DK303_001418 [Chloroflexota bacterium]
MNKRSIKINAGNFSVDATLNQSDMAEQIWNSLPLSGTANIWGDELYFGIPITTIEHSEASDLVSSGDIAFWPPGNAFCIFFGRTPASTDDEPRAASAVNVFGHINGDEKLFRGVSAGTEISIVVKG